MLRVVTHPLLADAIARARDRATPDEEFRALARRMTLLIAAEAMRDLATAETVIETPLERTMGARLAGRIVAVPVLRAGLGMLDAFLALAPSAQVGYFGLERNESTAVARCYYEKMPAVLGDAAVFLLDPMLATGGSAAMALEGLRARGARGVRLLTILVAPEGVARLEREAPDTVVYTASVDRELDARKYIRPGLGDFGDRLFGT